MNKRLIILATHGRPSQLETDIEAISGTDFLQWKGIPKALLPLSSRPALSWTLDQCRHLFQDIVVVTHAHNYKYYERWATSISLAKASVLNCGVSLGPVADIMFVRRVKGWQTGDIAIISSDYFIAGATEHFWSTVAQPGSPLYFTPGFVCAPLASVDDEMEVDSTEFSAQGYFSLLINHLATKVNPVRYHRPLSDAYIDLDNTLEHYLQHWSKVNDKTTTTTTATTKPSEIKIKAYARVGLMGNPSDGFYGKTMSLLISNFWAEVTLFPQLSGSTIEIIHKPIMNPNQFANMDALTLGCEQDGYDNGDRLLLACCKVFYRYCHQMGIALATDLGFQILFDTNIPRQVGLAGSSAIITACWKSLMVFYGVTTAQIPPEIQANLVLSVEVDELGIAAGLQDRVIQTYGGLVYMDFDKTLMHQIGRGRYIQLDTDLLPPLYLAYVADPEDSGKVHSTVKQRFLNGDTEIIQAMKQFGTLTDKARVALENGDHHTLASLMTDNFELRRKTYGDAVVGARNLQMVKIVRRHGGHAKFSGSGGAIVVFVPNTASIKPLQWDLEKVGFVFIKLTPIGSQI